MNEDLAKNEVIIETKMEYEDLEDIGSIVEVKRKDDNNSKFFL